MTLFLIIFALALLAYGIACLMGLPFPGDFYAGNCPDCMGEGCEYCDYTGWPDGKDPR